MVSIQPEGKISKKSKIVGMEVRFKNYEFHILFLRGSHVSKRCFICVEHLSLIGWNIHTACGN